MIKLFTSHELLTPQNRGKVHPLLFDLCYFEHTHPSLNEKYALVDQPVLADAFIFPIDFLQIKTKSEKNGYQQLYKLAQLNHKKLMVYTGGDYGKSFHDPTIMVWRTGGFKSSNDDQTIVIPAFINDPVQHQQVALNFLPYMKDPHISFTGFATPGLKERARVYAATLKNNLLRKLGRDRSDYQDFYNAAGERHKYLKQLEASSNVHTDFIYRNKYRAGARTAQERETSTATFFENLQDSPYTFCMRGAGNFSVRFYESLASGRIPVLIDTDCALPLENTMEWQKHVCVIDPKKNIVEQLRSFHHEWNEESFKHLQESNRRLYEDFLIRDRFFYHLYYQLKPKLK